MDCAGGKNLEFFGKEKAFEATVEFKGILKWSRMVLLIFLNKINVRLLVVHKSQYKIVLMGIILKD